MTKLFFFFFFFVLFLGYLYATPLVTSLKFSHSLYNIFSQLSVHIVQEWCVPARVSLYFVWTAQNELRDCPQNVLIGLLRMIWRQTVCQTLNSITVRCVVSYVAQFYFVQHPFPLFKHGGTVHHDMVGSLTTSFTRAIWCVF